MSKRSDRQAAERQAEREDAELKARIAALDARVEAQQMEHRNQLAQVRLEREAQELQAYAAQRIAAASAGGDIAPAFMRMLREGQYFTHAAIDAAISAAREGTAELGNGPVPASLPLAEQPRDTQTGRFVPTAPQPQQPAAEIDPSTLSLADYMALRGQLGVADHGEQNISRAPGHKEASGQGLFDGLPGYRDPRQVNQRVFESQLPDNRPTVPPGYLRRDADQNDEWR
jgi:hypothetical protein